MDNAGRAGDDPIEWGVAAAPHPGESASGDLHVVKRYSGGTLVAAIDALGHGPLAATAALRAARVLADGAGHPIEELCQRVHQSLIGDRGVVVSLAAFDIRSSSMTWAGIGNVEGVLVRGSEGQNPSRSGLVTRSGIIGGEFREVRPQQLPIDPGDVVVFATDGVHREFVNMVDPTIEPSKLAADLLAQHHRGTDDALVLAVRYMGARP